MFSFRDHIVQITPYSGPFANQPYRLLSGNKIALDPGASADHVAGFSEVPFDIVRKSAKPKISLEGMDAAEVATVRHRVGGIGGHRYIVSVIAQRPGATTFTIKCYPCEWSGGGGWQGEEGGSTDKIESLCIEVHINGESIFAKRHPR